MSASKVKNYRTDKYLKEFIDLNSLINDNENFYTITKSGIVNEVKKSLIDDYIQQIADGPLNVTSRFVERVKLLGGIYSEDPEKLGTLMNNLNAKVRDDEEIPQSIKDRAAIINGDKEEFNKLSGTKETTTDPRIKTPDLLEEMDTLTRPESVDLNETFMAEEEEEEAKPTVSSEVKIDAKEEQMPSPDPDDPNTSTEPKEPEQVASDTTITGPQKVKRYHPIPLGEFFGSIESDIDWDRELLQTILSSKMTAQEIIESSENVVTEFGRKINVLKRKSDTIEEYNELRQMAFCVMRNLQRGSRSKTASMKVSDLVTLYSGGKYSQEAPRQFGENRNFIPKINKVKLSPGDIYIKSESGPSLKYAPRTSRITTDNYL